MEYGTAWAKPQKREKAHFIEKVKPYIKLAAEAEEPVTLYGILTFKWDWVWNGKRNTVFTPLTPAATAQ